MKWLIVIAIFALLAFFLTPRPDEPVTVDAKSPTTTMWPQQSVPDLGDSFGQLVSATRHKSKHPVTTRHAYRSQAAGSLAGHACGGDLPPCYVMLRESGGDVHAFNPRGCSGYGCYGKWQFSGEWRCHFGLSCDIARWTEAEQDYAARTLWDHGRGCAHWAAC